MPMRAADPGRGERRLGGIRVARIDRREQAARGLRVVEERQQVAATVAFDADAVGEVPSFVFIPPDRFAAASVESAAR